MSNTVENNNFNNFLIILKDYVELDQNNINQLKIAIDEFSNYYDKNPNSNCLEKVNQLKAPMNPKLGEVFNNIINFFTFNKKVCYKLNETPLNSNETYVNSNDTHVSYKSKYLKYKMKYLELLKNLQKNEKNIY